MDRVLHDKNGVPHSKKRSRVLHYEECTRSQCATHVSGEFKMHGSPSEICHTHIISTNLRLADSALLELCKQPQPFDSAPFVSGLRMPWKRVATA